MRTRGGVQKKRGQLRPGATGGIRRCNGYYGDPSAGCRCGIRRRRAKREHLWGGKRASKAKSAEITKEYQRRFMERFKHLNCRELLAEKELQPTDTAMALAAGDHCGLLILSAAEILCGMIGEK